MADFKLALFHSGVVGSWLVAVNQGTAIVNGAFDGTLYLFIFLDYATPFAVSSCTSLLRNRSDRLAKSKPETESIKQPRFDNLPPAPPASCLPQLEFLHTRCSRG